MEASTQYHKETLIRYGVWTFLLAFALFSLFPLYWMLNTALKPLELINTFPPTLWPEQVRLAAFEWVLTTRQGRQAILDSLVVATGSTVLSVLLGTLAGYGFSRFGDKVGGENVAFWLLSTRMFPPIAIIIPIFFIWGALNLQDSFLGLILLYLTFNLPLTTWLMRDYFNKVPRSYEEMAYLNGYSIFGTFRRVALPLVGPGLVATTMLAWVFAWNEFLFALILSQTEVTPYTTVLRSMVQGNQILWNRIMAIAVLVTVPPALILLILRNYIIEGMTFGITDL